MRRPKELVGVKVGLREIHVVHLFLSLLRCRDPGRCLINHGILFAASPALLLCALLLCSSPSAGAYTTEERLIGRKYISGLYNNASSTSTQLRFDAVSVPYAGVYVVCWRDTYAHEVASDAAIDLLCQLMRYNPTERITPVAGIVHPYCEQFHDAPTEVACETLVSINHSDNKKYKTELYRDSLYGLVDKKYGPTTPKKKR